MSKIEGFKEKKRFHFILQSVKKKVQESSALIFILETFQFKLYPCCVLYSREAFTL